MTTAVDEIVRIRKEPLSDVRPAIKPIKGGPMRNPTNPSEATAVNAVPVAIVFDLPAVL